MQLFGNERSRAMLHSPAGTLRLDSPPARSPKPRRTHHGQHRRRRLPRAGRVRGHGQCGVLLGHAAVGRAHERLRHHHGRAGQGGQPPERGPVHGRPGDAAVPRDQGVGQRHRARHGVRHSPKGRCPLDDDRELAVRAALRLRASAPMLLRLRLPPLLPFCSYYYCYGYYTVLPPLTPPFLPSPGTSSTPSTRA